jgi:hypothetical protein
MVAFAEPMIQRRNQAERKDNRMSPTALDSVPESPAAERSDTRQPVDSRMNRIASRAHDIYEARGGEHGKALDDWLRAEREIDSETEAEFP